VKYFIAVFLILISGFLLFGDEVILKSGEIINGKIIFFDDFVVKIESEGVMYSIKKENVREINFLKDNADSKDKVKDIEDEGNENDSKKNKSRSSSDSFKSNMYDSYKSMLNAGFGFMIPGLILTFTPLIFGTVPIVMAIRFDNALNTREFFIPLSWYLGLIGVGLIFDAAAVVFFAVAGYIFRKYVKSNKVSLISGFNNDSTYMAIRFKL
jgi:preprotein translocase subunit YajC